MGACAMQLPLALQALALSVLPVQLLLPHCFPAG
jgi:hypothetical protein